MICRPRKRTSICYLCLNETFFIIEHRGNEPLNKTNEVISKCKHKIKFMLRNNKTWRLCSKCLSSEIFFWSKLFPEFVLNTETYKLNPRIHPECREIPTGATLNSNTFHSVDVRTLIGCLIPLYRKFIVISWLNDFEDMK